MRINFADSQTIDRIEKQKIYPNSSEHF